ncbi:MAG: hypothetical protein GX242_01150 [Clostridiales bacterium]|nr:hypothetical protein [Clostridiales bacterium]
MAKKFSAKIIVAIVLAVMLALFFCAINHTDDSAMATYNYQDTEFYINSQSDFDNFALAFSNSGQYFNGKTIYLNCNVDMGEYGSLFQSFNGTFYGNGYAINNARNAIFGNEIGSAGKVYDLVLNNVNITSSRASVAITNKGELKNIVVTGQIKNNTIGGLVYDNLGSILDSYICANLDVSAVIDSQGVGGIAYNNYGNIKESHFLGNIIANNTIKALGGLVAHNKVLESDYAKLENCTVSGEIHITSTGNEEYDSVLPKNCGTLVGNNLANLKNSYFIGYFERYLDIEVRAVGNDEDLDAPYPYQNIFVMTQDINLVYDSQAASFVDPGEQDISAYFDFSECQEVYVSQESFYPVFRHFEGYGTQQSPFLVRDVVDLFKLRTLYNSAGVIYYVYLVEDIDCRNFNVEIDLYGFEYSTIINGQGFALKNFAGQTLIADNQENILFDTGFYNAPNVTIGDSLFSETTGYSYGGIDGDINNIEKAEPMGQGTLSEPYIITSLPELAYLDGSSDHFKLNQSIIVNSATDLQVNYLNINSFYGQLDGNGYVIVGLFEPFISENYGEIKNLTVKGVISEDTNSLVSNENNGIIDSVNVYCSIIGLDAEIGCVAYQNSSRINKVKVVGNDATQDNLVGGITWTNNADGVIENCFVDIETNYNFVADNYGDIFTSIAKDTEYIAVSDNIQVEIDYFSLVDRGFDVENIFGYEVYTSYPYPTLREFGVQYKASSDFIYDKERTFNYTYDAAKSYVKANIQNLMKQEKSYITTGKWTYNGQEFDDGDTIENAGHYEVTLTFSGNDLLLPSKYTNQVVINKQTQNIVPAFDSGEFDNITYQYSGNLQEITEPVPNNLLDFGYTYTYTLMQGESIVDRIIDAGVYTQVIKGVSQNYTDVMVSRTITINKKAITIIVGNLNIDYLDSANLESAEIIINGLTLSDESKPLSQLVLEQAEPLFTTNYTLGDNVGEYDIDFSAEFINYDVTNVNKGKLIVNKIDLEQGDIVFEDKEVTYTSFDIDITVQNLPQGASVQYDNNIYSDAGQYLVTATISKPNYNDLVLKATLTITKAELIIKPNNITLSYNMARTEIDNSKFSYSVFGALGQDIDEIIALLNVSYTVTKDGEIIDTFDAGIYDIELEVSNELKSYDINNEKGILEITPSYLTTIYLSHPDLIETYSGQAITHPITFFETAILYEYYKGQEQVEDCIDAGVYTVIATVTKLNDNYLDTIYEYVITINKEEIDIYFEHEQYTAEYDKTNLALASSYPYSGTLPSELDATFSVQKNGQGVQEAVDVDSYVISYQVAESANYLAKTITASLVITPKEISITVQPSYTYTAKNIVLVITQIIGSIDNEITSSDFSFEYYNLQMVKQARITTAGSYVIRAMLNNDNYTLSESDYGIVVNKLTVSVDLKYLEYSYGYTGIINYGGIEYTIYSGGIVERKNYFIEETNSEANIRYQTASDHAGIYTVESLSAVENYNFVISADSQLDNNNKVRITPVTLNAIWRFGSTDISGVRKTLTYNGTDQFDEFSYTIDGFVKNHKQEEFTFELREINSRPLFDAGEYKLVVSLLNESNYVMGNATLEVAIEKAILNVKMIDTEVYKGEQFVRRYQILNAQGADSDIDNIYSLKGASLQVVTEYNTQASVGSQFEYYFTGTFTNYELNITQNGKVIVVTNPKVDVTFADKTFIYDGEYKSLKVSESQEYLDEHNIELIYSANNLQKEVGSYEITVIVKYNVDNTQKSHTRTLTIIKGTPRMELEQGVRTVYRDNYKLQPSDIKGKAYLGQNEIAGTFEFTQDYVLQKDTRQEGYSVRFIPEDAKNLNQVEATYYIDTIVLGQSALVYDDLTKITYTQNGVEISDRVTITLNESIIDGLTLYSNDKEVHSIILDKAQEIVIKIKYQGQVAFSQKLNVTLEEKKENEVINADETYLNLISGLKIDKATMLVSSMGGRIELDKKYADKYELYINGIKVSNDYPINGNEETIVISIVDAKSAITLFSKEYIVKQETSIEEPQQKDYRVYIIVASVTGAAAVAVVVFLIIRRAIRDRKIGFNPYK